MSFGNLAPGILLQEQIDKIQTRLDNAPKTNMTDLVVSLLDKKELIPDWWGKDREEELKVGLRKILHETK